MDISKELARLSQSEAYWNLPEDVRRETLLALDVGAALIPTEAGMEREAFMPDNAGVAPICLNNGNEISGNSQKIARLEGVLSGFTDVMNETKGNTEKILKEVGDLKLQAALDRQANEDRFKKAEKDIKNVADLARRAGKKIDDHIHGELAGEVSELKNKKDKAEERRFSTKQIIFTSVISGVAVGVIVLVVTMFIGG